VTALDVELSYLAAIDFLRQEHENLSFVANDLVKTKWPKGFDFVLCSEVIEHVKNPEKFAKSLSEATKPGGVLILSTPQPFSLMELTCRIGLSRPVINLVRRVYKEPVLPMGHVSLVSKSRILRILAANRFEVIESYTLGLYVPFLAEFGGEKAVSIAKWIESALSKLRVTWPMWTQVYVAVKEGS
jgi:2-polyprenyl-3-methyl-5-hydroxy-6-metoxy-1,4-benzoquinol methylase